jgi:ketosteroid isomerase-like protein
MSRANVEVVQRWVDAYNRRDIDGLIALTDPDIELRSRFVEIEPVLRGHEGIRAYFEELDEAYDHFEVVPIEFIDAGAAVVFAGHADWRGKESRAGGTTQIAPALWLRAGKVSEQRPSPNGRRRSKPSVSRSKKLVLLRLR